MKQVLAERETGREDSRDACAAEDGAAQTQRLDLRGLKCPLPALKTARHLGALAPGAELEVWADDPLAGLDIAHLCQSEGHALLAHHRDEGGTHRFRIRRAPPG